MDLIRDVLFAVENSGDTPLLVLPEIAGRSRTEIDYHLRLLVTAGLLDAICHRTEKHVVTVLGLTWAGHEFLDAARNEGIWSKVREKLGSTLVSVPFEILKELLLSLCRQQVGLSPLGGG
ncbi:MAG: DUF2513 domain-containing protein [Phycisphaerae bacterium]|nr:DUF2513 domain-containing protein [Phycisphaerae bacterium]